MSLLEIANLAGPIILAVMGAAVSIAPPASTSRMARRVWISSFVLVGLVCFVAAFRTADETKLAIADMLTGGNNYTYFSVDVADIKNLTDPVPLWMENTGTLYDVSYWIIPPGASRDANDPRYWKGVGGGFHTAYKGSFRIGKAIVPGDYLIEFSARNGSFLEALKLREYGGAFIQLIDVSKMDTGEKLYSSPRPNGYAD